MIYIWKENENIFDKYPQLFTIEEFAKLSDRKMKVVCLVCDLDSPISTLPLKERIERALTIMQWPTEGTRVDKNGRNIINGHDDQFEKACEAYKKNQWDEDQDTLNTINAQIQEIKDYLKSDKSVPHTYKGKVVLDSKGKETRVVDPKTLKTASELGEKLPGLVEASKKLQEILKVRKAKLEISTFTANDIEDKSDNEPMSTLDRFHQAKKNES